MAQRRVRHGSNGQEVVPNSRRIDVAEDFACLERLTPTLRAALRDSKVEFSAIEVASLLDSMTERAILALILERDDWLLAMTVRVHYGPNHPQASPLRPNRPARNHAAIESPN